MRCCVSDASTRTSSFRLSSMISGVSVPVLCTKLTPICAFSIASLPTRKAVETASRFTYRAGRMA